MSQATLLRIRSGSAALQRETQRIARSEELCSLDCTCAYFASDGRVEKFLRYMPWLNRVACAAGLRSAARTHGWVVPPTGSGAPAPRGRGALCTSVRSRKSGIHRANPLEFLAVEFGKSFLKEEEGGRAYYDANS